MRDIVRFISAAALLLPLSGCFDGGGDVATSREEILAPYRAALPASELDVPGVLTLERAQEIARLNNPNYLATLHLVNAARMRYYQALGSYLPELSAGFDLGQQLIERGNIVNPLETTVDNNNVFNIHTGLRATWLLFDGFARELEVLIRRRDEAYSQSMRENVLRLLDRAVAYAYYDVMLAVELQNIARADIVFQQSSLNQALSRHGSGFIAKSDLLGFRIDLARARVRLIRADESNRLTRYVLSSLLGFPDGELPPSISFPGVPAEVPRLDFSREFYLDEALNNRPDLAMERAIIAMRNYGKKQAVSDFFPRLYAFGALDYLGSGDQSRNNGVSLFHNFNQYSGAYGLSADWLIFNGFRRYNRYRELKELYEEAKLGLASKQLGVMAEVESACVIFQSNAEAAACFREMQQWVFEQRNLVDVEYWAGHVTITRLRGAQSDLVTAQSNFASSVIDVCKASAQLTAAVGGRVREWSPPGSPGTIDSIFNRLEQKFGEE